MADTTFVNAVTLTDAGWFNDANTVTYKGATTTMLVGGGVGSVAVWTTATGSGSPVRATSPTLVTPTIGAATATSVNKITLTAPATGATLTLTDGKTLAATNTLTLSGTDGTTMTFPTTSATLARTDAANTFTGVQTLSSQPILSSLTASLPVFSDGSKGLVSNAMTGTGNVMMSASPTTTGTLTAAIANFSGLLTANAGATVASGQTLTLTGATVAGAPTWSSSQAITLSTAAQPNVTSLGTLTGLVIVGNAGITGKLTEGFTSATTWAANTSATNLIISNSSATANSTALYEAGVTNTDSTYGAVKFGAVATGSYAADFVIAPRQVTTGTYIERLRVANNGVITITGDETVTGSLTAGATTINGALSLKSATWHKDTDGLERLYMYASGATVLKSGVSTGLEFSLQTAAGTDLFTITSGAASFGSNSLTAGAISGTTGAFSGGISTGSTGATGQLSIKRASDGAVTSTIGDSSDKLALTNSAGSGISLVVSATERLGLSTTGASITGTLVVTGVTTLTAQPILSSLTASLPVFSDGSKGLVSNAMTGTGNVVMSASPTLTGTIGAASMTLSGTLGVSGTTTLTHATSPTLSFAKTNATAQTWSIYNNDDLVFYDSTAGSVGMYLNGGATPELFVPGTFYVGSLSRFVVTGATGAVSTKDSISILEMTAPAGVANTARIFAQDNGAGKTQLMVIFGSGAAQQIAIEP